MKELIPSSAIAIVAHPDDLEYFCGGTIAKWTSFGCDVSLVVSSSGEKGAKDICYDYQEIIKQREDEQVSGASKLGVKNIVFLHYPDSELGFVDQYKLRGEYVRQIRKTRPEVVLTHDPFVKYLRQHPDHRTVGNLVLDASFPISTVINCYSEQIVDEGLETWQPQYVLLFGTDSANYWVDIELSLENKIMALEQHQSQRESFAGGVRERIVWKASKIGEKHSLKAAEEYILLRSGSALPGESQEETLD